jgi:hypothetical protein
MKKNHLKFTFLVSIVLFMFTAVFVGCETDEGETADTTELNALIDSCQDLLDDATTDDYPQTAIDALNAVLNTAKTALKNVKISQTQVDNLVVQLERAKEVFLAAAYGAIPKEALIMGLSFDEGKGTSLTTDGKKWTAVLKRGPAEIFREDTALPTFVAGKKGKAIHFEKGSHLEISDYTASDLMGSKLSIAVWVKPDLTRPGNYIISYNYWNSWKFQLQEQNKPFFTVHTNEDGWVDADNESDFSAPNEIWTHLAVTLDLTAKKLVFYVNGALTKEWDNTTKPGLTGNAPWEYKNTLPLLIGACTTYAEADAEWNWDWGRTPEGWDGFYGAIDELKVYNIALTDGQVAKLYKDEK